MSDVRPFDQRNYVVQVRSCDYPPLYQVVIDGRPVETYRTKAEAQMAYQRLRRAGP